MARVSMFEGASDVRISNSQFNSIVGGRDVVQSNRMVNNHYTNSNNRNETIIRDSFNDNSRRFEGPGASRDYRRHAEAQARPGRDRVPEEMDDLDGDGSESSDSTDESTNSERSSHRRPTHPPQRNTRPARPSEPSPQHNGHSAPEIRVAPSSSPPRPSSASPSGVASNTSTTVHAASAPIVPTQAALSPMPSPPPPPAAVPGPSSYLTVPGPQPINMPTNPPARPDPVPVQVQVQAHAPGSPSIASASTMPAPSSLAPTRSDQHIDLSARYRHLVMRKETHDEIKRRLIYVAQSTPKDRFFILKDQAARANAILDVIETVEEDISHKPILKLALEAHAVAFIAIMSSETKTPDEKMIFELLKILDNIEALVVKVVKKKEISTYNPFKRMKNSDKVGTYRKELESWLRYFKNDRSIKIDFALNQASKALLAALQEEQQLNAYAAAEMPQPTVSAENMQPHSEPYMRMPEPSLPPGSASTRIQDISSSAVALGSGSASVVNAEGQGNKQIYQNSFNNNSRNTYN